MKLLECFFFFLNWFLLTEFHFQEHRKELLFFSLLQNLLSGAPVKMLLSEAKRNLKSLLQGQENGSCMEDIYLEGYTVAHQTEHGGALGHRVRELGTENS